jgi:hypothetical protein
MVNLNKPQIDILVEVDVKTKERMSIPWEIYKEDLHKIYNNKYNYSKVVWKGVVSKVIVICKKHGEFSTSPNNHLRGKGCPTCGIESSRLAKLKGFDDYQPEFIKLYGDKYNYSSVVWEGGSKLIIVICKKHGKFHILPYLP